MASSSYKSSGSSSFFAAEQMPNSYHVVSPPHVRRRDPSIPTTADYLSSNPLAAAQSSTSSPSFGNINTPADSILSQSIYQGGDDFSDNDPGDPFFGANFDGEGGTPSFLGDSLHHPAWSSHPHGLTSYPSFAPSLHGPNLGTLPPGSPSYPITPEKTASLHTMSPSCPPGRQFLSGPGAMPTSISPQELQRPFANLQPISTQPTQAISQPTPDSCQSSEDGLQPNAATIPAQSPRVTVSLWNDKDTPMATIETAVRDSTNATRNTNFSPPPPPSPPVLSEMDGIRRGLGPEERPSVDIESPNDMVRRREIEERKHVVSEWLSQRPRDSQILDPGAGMPIPRTDTIPPNSLREIPLGNRTENKYVDGQTYFKENASGPFNPEDLKLILSNRNWADGPVLHKISQPDNETERHQPVSSNDAIIRFHRMCNDNESIVSRAATWGTRRRSLPSLLDVEIDNLGGNLLKKLTISRGESRASSLLGGIKTLVRTNPVKRSFSGHNEENFKPAEADRAPYRLAPTRTSSWGRRTSISSINTALVSMGTNAAAVGAGQAGHSRSGSTSAPQVTSPKTPFGGLAVKRTSRQRSHSDLPPLPRPIMTQEASHPNLVGLWKRTGGPPVAQLANTSNAELDDDDEEEDDDAGDHPETQMQFGILIDDVTPDFQGFRDFIVGMFPYLAKENPYLADRIANHQVQRYKHLLTARLEKLQPGEDGGAALSNQRPNALSARNNSTDGNFPHGEGALLQSSFPRGIPMPPTQSLPARFECQLCFQYKTFKKPSDWTKHVHEDVQPFSCTWENCKEPIMFKRKADWVRHESEGHRHTEWWSCQVEGCEHMCYRRDNFLQHLVREHRFDEPKIKTKAAVKRAGASDPTWQMVQRCHVESDRPPSEEPCRFCGETLHTWKNLTVHLAQHMERISLPVLRLVAKKELSPDTMISPIQDFVPQQQFVPAPTNLHAAMFPAAGPLPVHMADGAPSSVFPDDYSHVDLGGSFATPAFGNIGYNALGTGFEGNTGIASANAIDNVYVGSTPISRTGGNTQPMQHGARGLGLQSIPYIPVTTDPFASHSNVYPGIVHNVDGFSNGLPPQPFTSSHIGQDDYDAMAGLAPSNGFPTQASTSSYGFTSHPAGHSYYTQ